MNDSKEIQMNFDSAQAQADKLDALATSLEQKIVKSMDSSAQELRAAWKGDEATRFIGKEVTLQTQIKQTVQDLRNIASDVRAAAKRMYKAETEALRIAQQSS